MVYRGNGAASRCNNYSPGGCVGQSGRKQGMGRKVRLLSKAINLFALQGDAYDLISG